MSTFFGVFDCPPGGNIENYTYSGKMLRDVVGAMISNGVFPEIRFAKENSIQPTVQLGKSLSVSPGAGLELAVNPGIAIINGAIFAVVEAETLTLQAGFTNDIVLRLDETGISSNGEVVFGLFVKQRSGGSIEENLTRESGVYELGLHSVAVPTNTGQVTAGMITDHRFNLTAGTDGKPCCGIASSLMSPDIDDWYVRSVAALNRMVNEYRAKLDAIVLNGKSSMDSLLAEGRSEIDSLKYQFSLDAQRIFSSQTKEFDAWFTGEKSKTAQLIREAADKTRQEILDNLVFRSPVTGLLGGIQPILYDIFNAVQLSRIKVNEFDALGITAKDFDHKQITAYEFDTRAKQIFLVGGGTPDAGSE